MWFCTVLQLVELLPTITKWERCNNATATEEMSEMDSFVQPVLDYGLQRNQKETQLFYEEMTARPAAAASEPATD